MTTALHDCDPADLHDDSIAIIGIGCRFPGGADGPGKFWDRLTQGFDAVAEVGSSRPDFSDLYDSDPRRPGRLYSRWGGFLERTDWFDAHFFGISPREAIRIDPQHRLLLELLWEACEDAGLPPGQLAGTNAGVFVGISTHDYGDMQMYPSNRGDIDMYSNSGTATSIAANRLSYLYDLRGPSLTVDTACSSALTAVHLACRSLLAGECTLAVAAAVQMVLRPELTIGFCKASMLSPDGRCKAFDASANGYVRGEGGGVVLLKPWKQAQADGDSIYAVIRATAINQDGRTSGMTVPSKDAQRAMMREALAKSGIAAADVYYVEAHGTGTPVGDPIEASAIGEVMVEGRREGDFCAVGSVKTNIGHLEAAAGIAGLIKVALALKHRRIPPSLHFSRPSEAIDFAGLRLRVVTGLENLPESNRSTVMGVNAFGFGGANAHVLLQERPPQSTPQSTPLGPQPNAESAQLLVLSARSPEALKSMALSNGQLIAGADSPSLADICYTAARRREHHEYRVSVVANSRESMSDSLSAFAASETRNNVSSGRIPHGVSPQPAFVFSGMGPQWWGMGRQLRAEEPVFRDTLQRCDAALREYSDWSLLEELSADEGSSRVADPRFAQVTNFAIQVALSELWAAYGVKPAAVIGHSGGAMAAAYVAGVYSLEDALRLTFHRSRLQGRAANEGRMLAVGATVAEIEDVIRAEEAAVSVAAVNGRAMISLSGDADALERINGQLILRQIFTRFLQVNIAYHSPAMDKIRDEFVASLPDLQGQTASLPLMSDTTGTWADGPECDVHYWWRAIRQPVLFHAGITAMIQRGFHHFVEISPHPVLSASVADCLKEQGIPGLTVGSIRRGEDERTIMLRGVGALYSIGASPRWTAVQPRGKLVSLPGYPWQRERFWFEPTSPGRSRSDFLSSRPGDHPLLGNRARSACPTWESLIGTDQTQYLHDHVIQNLSIFPAAGYVELALAAGTTLSGQESLRLRDMEFIRPLVLDPSGTSLQVAIDLESSRVAFYSTDQDESWKCHCCGLVGPQKRPTDEFTDLEAIRLQLGQTSDPDAFYAQVIQRGLAYGPAFRGIQSLWIADRQALASISGDGLERMSEYRIHPAMLDSAFQLLIAAAQSIPDSDAGDRLFLPMRINEIRFYARPGDRFWAHAQLTELSESTAVGDVRVYSDSGQQCVEVRGLTARLLDPNDEQKQKSKDGLLYSYVWEPKPRPSRSAVGATSSFRDLTTHHWNTVNRYANEKSIETSWCDYYAAVEERLNELATASIVKAVKDRGHRFEHGDRLRIESFVADDAEPWRRSLAKQLIEILQRVNLVQAVTDGWERTDLVCNEDSETLAAAILSEYPDHRLDVELLARCGPRLADVLGGRCDGRDVLFAEDGFEFLEQFYRHSPASAFYNGLVAEVISEFQDVGKSQPLRILEVGGGTGGTTAHVLPRLHPDSSSYVFTDVSPLFTEHARTKWSKNYPFFGTKLYDISKDPFEQGLEPESFDLIIAANVLHATPAVKHSVKSLATLLAPGGAILLLEITRHPYWLDIVFGLTETWWSFSDRELRPTHPLMTGQQWQRLLQECRLEHLSIVADSDPAQGEPAQSILIAHRSCEVSAEAAPLKPGRWLIFADQGGVGRRLAEVLRSQQQQCTLVFAGTQYHRGADNHVSLRPGDSVDMQKLIAESLASSQAPVGVVHLWSLDIGDTSRIGSSSDCDLMASANQLGCGSLMTLLQQMPATAEDKPSLVVITAGAQAVETTAKEVAVFQSSVWGFARTILHELPGWRCRMIDVSGECSDSEILALAEEVVADSPDGPEEELALRGRQRFVHRLRTTTLSKIAEAAPRMPVSPSDQWLATAKTTSLDDIRFESASRRELEPDQVEVAVEAASLNFRDVVLTVGLVPGLESDKTFGKKQLGSDCAGTITRVGANVTGFRMGDRVFGIAPASFAAYAVTQSCLLVHQPPNLSAEEASAVPVAYVTAWYALTHLARLKAGESVLIHAATGGVGLAAIAIAQHLGAEIFATAGSDSKRAHLQTLGIKHIFDSRSLAFADEVRDRTGGRGVDVVLNSLSGEALELGLASLAPYGRFVELGKSDIYRNSRLGLEPFKRNLSLFAVDLDRMSYEKPELVGTMLREIVELLETQTLKPLPITVFAMDQLTDSMRLLAQAKHIGKIVVRRSDAVRVCALIPDRPPIRKDATFLITGGLGGLGLSITRWLVDQGAENMVLISRSQSSAEVNAELETLRRSGVRIETRACDVTRQSDVQSTVEWISQHMPPLAGIFHAAMVLDDVPLLQLTPGSLDRVMAPKVLGAWLLHEATREVPLDFFVSFSSITSVLGNAHQANYAAANAFLDSFAAYRRASGLVGTTINWGVVSDSGYVARHPEIGEFLAKEGYLSITPDQLVETLSDVLRHDAVNVMAARIDWKQLSAFAPRFTSTNRLRHLVPVVAASVPSGGLRMSLSETDVADRHERLGQYLREQLGRLLGTSPSAVETDRPLNELGLDSLIATELTVVLDRDLGVDLPTTQLLSVANLHGMVELVLSRLRLDSNAASPQAVTPGDPMGAAAKQFPSPALISPAHAGSIEENRTPTADDSATYRPVESAAADEGIRLASAPPKSTNIETSTIDYRRIDYTHWTRMQHFFKAVAQTGFGALAHVSREGFENLPPQGPYIIAANHLSMLDVPLLLSLLPTRAIIMAKRELRKSRFLNWFLSDLGQTIFVEPNEADEESLRNALQVLQSGGVVGLAPEGARSRTGTLIKGRTGVAYLAIKANVPVIPVAAWGQESWRSSLRRGHRMRISVRVGVPLSFASESSSPDALRRCTDQVMSAIANLMPHEYRGVYAGSPEALESTR